MMIAPLVSRSIRWTSDGRNVCEEEVSANTSLTCSIRDISCVLWSPGWTFIPAGLFRMMHSASSKRIYFLRSIRHTELVFFCTCLWYTSHTSVGRNIRTSSPSRSRALSFSFLHLPLLFPYDSSYKSQKVRHLAWVFWEIYPVADLHHSYRWKKEA